MCTSDSTLREIVSTMVETSCYRSRSAPSTSTLRASLIWNVLPLWSGRLTAPFHGCLAVEKHGELHSTPTPNLCFTGCGEYREPGFAICLGCYETLLASLAVEEGLTATVNVASSSSPSFSSSPVGSAVSRRPRRATMRNGKTRVYTPLAPEMPQGATKEAGSDMVFFPRFTQPGESRLEEFPTFEELEGPVPFMESPEKKTESRERSGSKWLQMFAGRKRGDTKGK